VEVLIRTAQQRQHANERRKRSRQQSARFSLDPSENIKDRKAAIASGVARNQKEIWDVKNQTGIKTGGSGT
jgi:hypothetical protein